MLVFLMKLGICYCINRHLYYGLYFSSRSIMICYDKVLVNNIIGKQLRLLVAVEFHSGCISRAILSIWRKIDSFWHKDFKSHYILLSKGINRWFYVSMEQQWLIAIVGASCIALSLVVWRSRSWFAQFRYLFCNCLGVYCLCFRVLS